MINYLILHLLFIVYALNTVLDVYKRQVLTCGYDYQGRRFSKKVTVNGLTASYCLCLYRGYLQVAQLDLMRPSYRLAKTYLWDPTEPMRCV